MLEASESGLIIDPDRLEGKFEDFIGVYRRLVHHEICNTIISNFENRHNYKIKFDLVSMIGAMTYCKNFEKLFSNLSYYLAKNGDFIFSHRIDLWKKQNFDKILDSKSDLFKIKYLSRPIKYLPLNKDFNNKIKIRVVLLQKN